MFLKFISFFLPWPLKRWVLSKWFKFELHPTAYIGLAWVFPRKLVMGEGTKIDHFTVAINLDKIEMGKDSTIGRSNWITGFPIGSSSRHFKHQVNRQAELKLGESSHITKGHHIDCTNLIIIGKFSTIAGYQSQLLTHSVDLLENQQSSGPILIGDYAFVGTNVVILGGASLPSYSVLGAKSLLNKAYNAEWKLYGGVPAKELGDIPKDAKYFSRTSGFVY